jgi:hypothetical protein
MWFIARVAIGAGCQRRIGRELLSAADKGAQSV